MHLLPRHMMESISRWLAQEGPPPRSPFWEFSRLSYELRPGDVVLLEGRSRICAVIKSITQSSRTHSVLYIGHLFDIDDRHLQARIRGSYEGDPGEQLVVEALLGQGGVISPLIKYRMHHLRICRPAGLDPRVARRVGEYTPHHLYCDYDMRQMFDLARFFFPWSILPRRWRSSLRERVQARSDKIKQYRALLNDPDQTIRLAALDEMTRSADPTMREIAFEAGFNSADMAMQAIALHAKLRLTDTLTVQLTEPISDDKSVQRFVNKRGTQYVLTLSDFKDENGSFTVQWGSQKGAGQVSGANLSWKVYYMTAEFKLEDGAILKGNISWSGSEQMPALIRLH